MDVAMTYVQQTTHAHLQESHQLFSISHLPMPQMVQSSAGSFLQDQHALLHHAQL
jgi:hypothetical protein